jgi:hypothetical protein
MILMSKLNLLTIGETIDQIQKGQIAISIHPDDNDTIMGVNHDGWLKIKHPKNNYFSLEFAFRKAEGIEDKRWLIMKEPENFYAEEDQLSLVKMLIKELEDK